MSVRHVRAILRVHHVHVHVTMSLIVRCVVKRLYMLTREMGREGGKEGRGKESEGVRNMWDIQK